ncbi:hypothetical protein ACG33_00925 [Steroidobacter denitrificans]|uniref:Outer membrane protein beta-barrel domain-containing protein n=1 Tax=Steroidobacter denitrificans TaxID=465721 RepID=A0A127F7U2_STEDE|nr:outer membrane beta-barrel protein [Steroidobacter denitrificans]AMN45691.1 hypothetical protein ACG33_00925 [Steroidobacter denitrificans]
MQRRISSLLAALIATALPVASQADTMNYTYIELGYVDTEIDVGPNDLDGDGFALRGSLAVHENFFVFTGYEDLDFERGVDSTTFHLGGGARWPLGNKLDIVGRVAIVKSKVEFGSRDQNDNGFLLGARLRGEVAPKFELEGGFEYVDLDDLGNDTAIVLEGRYFFLDALAGGLTVQSTDDANTIGINLRYTF